MLWVTFCLIHSSCWFYDHFFAWNHGNRICFLWETQKYVEILNNIWIIKFYVGILAFFGNFWSNICFIHSSCWSHDHVYVWNNWTQICFLFQTQKYIEILNNIWVIISYIRILANFGNFWPNFCLIHSSRWFYDYFFAWNS